MLTERLASRTQIDDPERQAKATRERAERIAAIVLEYRSTEGKSAVITLDETQNNEMSELPDLDMDSDTPVPPALLVAFLYSQVKNLSEIRSLSLLTQKGLHVTLPTP